MFIRFKEVRQTHGNTVKAPDVGTMHTRNVICTGPLAAANVEDEEPVVDVSTGRIEGHTDAIYSVAIHPSNADLIATASGDDTVLRLLSLAYKFYLFTESVCACMYQLHPFIHLYLSIFALLLSLCRIHTKTHTLFLPLSVSLSPRPPTFYLSTYVYRYVCMYLCIYV